jgi:hypothetical protein
MIILICLSTFVYIPSHHIKHFPFVHFIQCLSYKFVVTFQDNFDKCNIYCIFLGNREHNRRLITLVHNNFAEYLSLTHLIKSKIKKNVRNVGVYGFTFCLCKDVLSAT